MKKKYIRVLSIVFAIALLLTGCTAGGGVSTTTTATTSFSPSSIEDDASLSIYIYTGGFNECYLSDVYDFYADYKTLINISIKEFEDSEEMESRLQLELAAGQGPDVILAASSFGLDMMSLAKNGAFYDLTDVIAADDTFNDENYYLSIMEAGQINDRQYVIPLSFTLPTFVSTTTNLQELGIDPETDTTLEIYEKILAHLRVSDIPQISNNGGVADATMTMMQACGKAPVSYETGEVFQVDEETKMIMELGAEVFKDVNAYMTEQINSANASFSAMAKVPLSYVNYLVSPVMLQTIYSAYAAETEKEEVVFYFASDEDGDYHALVQEFAAVNANAKNPEIAWIFLRSIMNHKLEYNDFSAMSLNRNTTQAAVRRTMSMRGVSNGFVFESMPQELADQLLSACDTIGSVSISQNSQLANIFRDGERAYRAKEVTIDTMIEDIQNKVKLYMNE